MWLLHTKYYLVHLCEDETPNDTAKTIKGSLLSKNLTIVACFSYCMYIFYIVLRQTDLSEGKDVKIKTNLLLEFKNCHYNYFF